MDKWGVDKTRADKSRLIEVWGDTVDSRHLLGSIVLGVGIAVPVYLVAQWGFGQLTGGSPLSRSYALVSGLISCVLAAVIAARIFPPKRIVVIGQAQPGSRAAAMDAIEAEIGPLGNPDELPPAALAEVKALGLYEDLAAQHHKNLDPANLNPGNLNPADQTAANHAASNQAASSERGA